MNYNNSPYDAVGVAIVGELFKQAETVLPISEEAPKPSVFKRLLAAVKPDRNAVISNPCDKEMNAQSTV